MLAAIDRVLAYTAARAADNRATLAALAPAVAGSAAGEEGLAELSAIAELTEAAGAAGRIVIDPSVVRGLEYYTGPVFEAELTFEMTGEDGKPIRFGSVGGGGRYDGLVARFRGEAGSRDRLLDRRLAACSRRCARSRARSSRRRPSPARSSSSCSTATIWPTTSA